MVDTSYHNIAPKCGRCLNRFQSSELESSEVETDDFLTCTYIGTCVHQVIFILQILKSTQESAKYVHVKRCQYVFKLAVLVIIFILFHTLYLLPIKCENYN
jgi:hypothetical protein